MAQRGREPVEEEEEKEEEGVGNTVKQDQEHTVTREHTGRERWEAVRKRRILSLTFYYSTIFFKGRDHTLSILQEEMGRF